MRLLCVGHSALDTIYRVPRIPKAATKVFASACIEAGGGMAASASVAARRLGADSVYCGRVGSDDAGARILAQLTEEGVDVARVRRIDGCRSTTATILVDNNGERLVCVYDDPALDADPSWLALDDMRAFGAVLADVRWPQGAARVFDAARESGVPAILDGDVGDPRVLRELCARCDYAIFSAAGLALATDANDPVEGLHRAQRLGGALVGATLGQQGFAWLEGGRVHRADAPRVDAIDTLAAGDVFHGAFALAIGEGRRVADAARFANAAAALKCTRFGGRLGAPSRSEVEAFIAVQPT